MLGNGCQHVIPCLIDGLQQVGGDTTEGSIGCQQLYQYSQAQRIGNAKHYQQGIAQPFLLFRIAVAVLLDFLAPPSYDILHDAQRADDTTVYTSEDKRQQYQTYYHHHVHGKDSLQQLHLGHPAEPVVRSTCEIYK